MLNFYYITVESMDGQLQFTREAWPSISIEQNNNEKELINLIPNGQFLLHNTISAQENRAIGEINQAITYLAPGGWTFQRPEHSRAKDLVVFERFGSSVNNPSGYPRYAIRIENQLPCAGDLFKDLRISFHNVNRFALNKQFYTFSFAAQTNTGNTLTATLLLIKDYGQGGSPLEEKIIKTVTINPSYLTITVPFIFGENQNKTLSLKDDDTLSIALRFPTHSVFDVSLTDFMLSKGNNLVTDYPQITDNQVISQSLAGNPIPAFDGSDYYLPIYSSKKGFIFYNGDIGKIYSTAYPKPNPGELLCDGSRYLSTGISTDEIPYSRLAKKLWDDELTYYRYGTGVNFVTAVLDSEKARIRLTTNQPGSAIASSAGTSGFTITPVVTGNNYYVQAFAGRDSNKIICKGSIIGATAAPDAKISGFTLTDLRNSSATNHLFQIECTEPKNLAGQWLQFSTTNVTYYVWFTVDSQGIDPKPASLTGIKLELFSTQTANEVALCLAETLNGHQMTLVKTYEASQIKPGRYWTFATTTPENFYVWYRKNKQGSDPKADGTGIVVDIEESDTAEQVIQKTRLAINQAYFAVPDLRGVFLRGWDKDKKVDTGDRFFNYGQGLLTNTIGSFELDEILSHNHSYTAGLETHQAGEVSAMSGYHIQYLRTSFVDYQGGNESRPFNSAINFVIKY